MMVCFTSLPVLTVPKSQDSSDISILGTRICDSPHPKDKVIKATMLRQIAPINSRFFISKTFRVKKDTSKICFRPIKGSGVFKAITYPNLIKKMRRGYFIPGASIQGKPSIAKQVLSNLPIVIHCMLHHWYIS
jgi:hypothetical protein